MANRTTLVSVSDGQRDSKGRFVKGMTAWHKGLTKETDERLKIKGKSQSGMNHHNWKGGEFFDGYTLYVSENGRRYIKSHRVWCEENQIGCVPIGCEIHHIDLNPLNNEPDNLILLDNQTHRKLHYKIQLEQNPDRIYFGKNIHLRGGNND